MKSFKCPVCSVIQFKGRLCKNDGNPLIECDLGIENQLAQSDLPTPDSENMILNHLLQNNADKSHELSSEMVKEILLELINDLPIVDAERDQMSDLDEDLMQQGKFSKKPRHQREHQKPYIANRAPNSKLSDMSINEIIKNSHIRAELVDQMNSAEINDEPKEIITFMSVLPGYFKKDFLTLEICFMYDQSYQKINIYYEKHIENFTDSNDIKITFRAHFPSGSMRSRSRIVYFYYLTEIKRNGFVGTFEEDYLYQKRKLRTTDSKDQQAYLDLHMDGIIYFNQFYDQYKQNEIYFLKVRILSDILTSSIDSLWKNNTYSNNDNADNYDISNAFHSNIIEFLTKVYDSLCAEDYEFKVIFRESMTNEFVQRIRNLHGQTSLTTSDYLTVLSIFYCCYKFSLNKCFNDREWFRVIFKLHNITDLRYFNQLDSVFHNQKEYFLEALERILELNKQSHRLIEGYNSLNVLYFMSNFKNQEKISKNLSNLFKYSFLDKKLNQIEDFIKKYDSLLSNSNDLSALFIDFFGLNNLRNIDSIIHTKFFSPISFIHYLNILIVDPTKRADYKLAPQIRKIFIKILIHLNQLNIERLNRKDLSVNLCFNKLQTLFEHSIKYTPKEYELIGLICQLNLIYLQINEVTINPNSKNYFNSFDSFETIMNLIRKYINKECDEGILVNYGLTDRPKDKVSRQRKSYPLYPDSFEMPEKSYLGTGQEASVYDFLLSVSVQDVSHGNRSRISSDAYRNTIIEILKNRFMNSKFEDLIHLRANFGSLNSLKNYQLLLKELDSVINELLDQNTLPNLEILCEYLTKTDLDLLQYYIDLFLDRNWKKDAKVDFCLNWRPFLYLAERNLMKNASPLNDKWKLKFQEGTNYLADTINRIIKGKETLENIKTCFKSIETLVRFNAIILEYPAQTSQNQLADYKKLQSNFKRLIECRHIEAQTFESYNNYLMVFSQYFSQFKIIDLEQIDSVLKTISSMDINSKPLSTFCRIIRYEEIDRFTHDFHPNITFFKNIGHSEINRINSLINLDRLRCVIFDSIFVRVSQEYLQKKAGLKKLPINFVLDNVIPQVLADWKHLAVNLIESGRLKLVEIENYLEKYFKGNYDKFSKEIFYIIQVHNIRNFEERKRQINLYSKLKSSVEAAKIIEEIRVNLNIAKPFAEINDVLKMNTEEFKEWTLLKMDFNLDRTISILYKIADYQKISCLKAFLKSIDLVLWLKNNLKDLNQLKFLVDLTSMAKTNEFSQTANNEVLAKILKEAGIAYAPLIFDTKPQDNFEKFMNNCGIVWQHLDTDKKIGDKLVAVNDQIPVLKQIIFKKGNVELSSINQAKQFNENGIYKVGLLIQETPRNGFKSCALSRKISLANLIELEIQLDLDFMETSPTNRPRNDKVMKKYTYNQLIDLKGILMLVARKSSPTANNFDDDESETLEYFIEIFDNIVRLAEIYIKLINKGCLLFDHFLTRIHCDISSKLLKSSKPIAVVDFDAHLKSSRNSYESRAKSTIDSLKDIINFMEKSYNLWLDYIASIRNNFNSINHFTINQINYLQKHLSEIVLNDNYRFQDNPDYEQVQALMYSLDHSVLGAETIRLYFSEMKSIKNKSKKKTSKNDDFITEIATNHYFSYSIVKKAVKMFGVDEYDKIIDYCISNDTMDEDDMEESDTSSGDEDVEMKVDDLTDFKDTLNSVWMSFMKNQINNTNDTLNVETLAKFFDFIQEKLSFEFKYKREVPGYLNYRGRPNLIMCSTRDQIAILLSIYAHTIQAPLPTNDEVLFCSPATTSEEVENFFRIAFKSNGDKIYSLVNIQDLTYENSIQIEKFLSNNTQIKQTDNYILVCICTTDRQDQSILGSSLIKNRISPILLPSNLIEDYIRDKLSYQKAYFLDQSTSVQALLSRKAGNGKSTYVNTFIEDLKTQRTQFDYKIIRIKSNNLDVDEELRKLIDIKQSFNSGSVPIIYHIDIAFEVFKNVDLFLFNLAILGYLMHTNGLVWRRSKMDLYFIEMMPPYLSTNANRLTSFHSILNYLPRIDFRSPRDYAYSLSNLDGDKLRLFKDNMFKKYFKQKKFQRTSYYLRLLRESPNELADFNYGQTLTSGRSLTQLECLKILLDYSELKNPNWAELYNFANFLDLQLEVLENAHLINPTRDLRSICAKLLIMMAYDFGLPSLNLGNDSNVFSVTNDNQLQVMIDKLEIARRWENMSHPYIIFNADKQTFTFMGIYLKRSKNNKFINPKDGEELDIKGIQITSQLLIELLIQEVPIYENFNDFPRTKKINSLRYVMGLDSTDQISHDPDPTYELAIDNCLKLMAIFMRLRCNNPVIIMGETGCGKTRKMKFLSDLHLNPKIRNLKHLIHFKIHGGTTAEEIERKVEQAERLSAVNQPRLYGERLNANFTNQSEIPASAILFFDEANTTEAIGLIKDIMCDLTCNGRKINIKHGLKIVAAVNPYRKHSDEMIRKLEEAGLGFFISSTDSKDKLGHIPLRQLVYRVQPLPASMLPLVWDFGQIDSKTERDYIKQMIDKAIKQGTFPKIDDSAELGIIYELLTGSQDFMRNRMDECSFVSLRDIERVIKVTAWFISKQALLFSKMSKKELRNFHNNSYLNNFSTLRRAIVLALAVCYHSSLHNIETRFSYRKMIAEIIPIRNYEFSRENDWVLSEILRCQHVFLDNVKLNNNIARNSALLENVFMIIVCLELRIPLFIVGKPGSSKSLAKNIVANAMEGKNSKTELFKNLKETYFVNFQCSPLTKPEMIIAAFKEAASFQENNDLEKSVAVVNLDEIGLAEASESMPLKTLHPLLEEGTDSSDSNGLPHQKVGVIGISNWALDPAKMNRGIFVSRGEPDINELVESAKGICKYDDRIYNCIEPFIREITQAYLEVCQIAREFKREFFGLRDFYSLIKMLYYFCSKDGKLTWNKLEHSVRRNFGGLDIDSVGPFHQLLHSKLDKRELDTDPKCGPIDLIHSALKGENVESNSRYLLFLSENYSVIEMVQNYLSNVLKTPRHKIVVIFGSSFRHDLQYTEVCRNISRIKQSMEIGNTVILLNFYNLYESLYDALNQYYYEFAGQRYIYLGLGTHRVSCAVHEDFRSIIISDKESVYDPKRFPIPLINRLEKHFLSASTMLKNNEKTMVENVEKWAKSLCNSVTFVRQKLTDIFIGYHDDTIPSIVLYSNQRKLNLEMMDQDESDLKEDLLNTCKRMLLRCATADSIIRISNSSKLSNDQFLGENLWNEYFMNQKHSSLKDLIKNHLETEKSTDLNRNLLQITTHSKLTMSKANFMNLAKFLGVKTTDMESCLLQSFETQSQFGTKIKSFLVNSLTPRFLFIQCGFSKSYDADLMSCARYTIVEQIKQSLELDKHVMINNYIILIVNLPHENSKNFIGFQVGQWSCYHIDELEDSSNYLPTLESMKNKPLSVLLNESLTELRNNQKSSKTIDLRVFLNKISSLACSLLIDTNISRTIIRIGLFNKLCENDDFLSAICNRLVSLQEEKENEYIQSSEIIKNWLPKEVANLKNINEYSTLTKSCQNYLENKTSPLLAFILSKTDKYSNLDLYSESLNVQEFEWKKDLWIKILNNKDVLKLPYSDMRNTNNNQELELKNFHCKSDWLEKKFKGNLNEMNKFKPKLPFFWLLVNQLNGLFENFNDSLINISSETNKYDNYIKTIPYLFESTEIYRLIESNSRIKENILDYYINDFVLVNCDVKIEAELNIIKKVISKFSFDSKDIRVNLPHVHYEFYKIKKNIKEYLKISNFEPKINEILNKYTEFNNIELESCLICVDIVEKQPQSSNFLMTIHNIAQLIQLVRNNLVESSDYPKYETIKRKYDSLRLLYLFIDNVVISMRNVSQFNQDTFKWMVNILKINYLNSLDFISLSSIEKIHDFLVKCVVKARQSLFKENTLCKSCNRECMRFRKFLTLSCNCFVCIDCDNQMRSRLIRNKTICLSCKKEISIEDPMISMDVAELEDLKLNYDIFVENLNVFYLNVVELLFFKNTTEVELNVFDSILRIITDGKILNKNGVHLPILQKYKSLLLQIIFRNQNSLTSIHLESWFSKFPSYDPANPKLFDEAKEMALFFQNCVLDYHFNQILDKNLNQEIEYGLDLCTSLLENIRYLPIVFSDSNSKFQVEHLVFLSKLKFCLRILAKCSSSQLNLSEVMNTKAYEEFNSKMKQIVEKTNPQTTILYNYVIKEIIRKYSYSSIKFLMAQPNINWMVPQHIIGDNLNVSDGYILIGPKYVSLKAIIAECFHENKPEKLENYLTQNSDSFAVLCMALYKNVTLLYKDVNNIPIKLFIPLLTKLYGNYRYYWQPILENMLAHNLKINSQNWSSIEVNLLLVQLKFSILFSKSMIIKPLITLITSPKEMKDKYIPGMPQDSLFDIHNAIRLGTTTDNPKFYACPNGHIYVLFDCGRPWVKLQCKTCGEDIGGTQHILLETNREINVQDNTARGYCLIDSDQLDMNPKNERVLNAPAFHIIRFFINACMYFACDTNEADVYNMMTVNPEDKKKFFWKHMIKDITIASRSLNINQDELIVLLHYVCDDILTNDILFQSDPFDKWNSKEDRQSWEQQFFDKYLAKKLKDPMKIVNEATRKLQAEDKEDEGSNKLYFMAYEQLNEDKSREKYIYEKIDFWKYYPTVNLETLRIELMNGTNPDEFVLLKKFIHMQSRLKCVLNLSNMIKLINYLQNNYYKNIFKHFANMNSIKYVFDKGLLGKEWTLEKLKNCVTSFQNVWFESKDEINSYIHSNISPTSNIKLSVDYKFSLDSRLSLFLPTLHGDGLVSYALIHYLSKIHNEMILFYYDSRKLAYETVDISLFENEKEYLIYFDHNNDLLRIIQSNFSFSSKDSKFLFRFDNITRQIVERFIETKPSINMKSIPLFEYSDEISDFALFSKLNEIIVQEPLSLTVQANIFNDFITISQTAEALNLLKIVINYARIASASKDDYISHFIKKIYVDHSSKNLEQILRPKIIENCQLKHLKNLWLLLMMKRSFLYTINNQEPFETLHKAFKETTELELSLSLNPLLTLSFAFIVYQMISFSLSNQSEEELQSIATTKLKIFFESLESLNILIPENANKINNIISDDIEMKNIYSIWTKLTELMKRFD